MTKSEAKELIDNYPDVDVYIEENCNKFGTQKDYHLSRWDLAAQWFAALRLAYPPDNQPKKD